jgi:CBS domain-containing protein
MSAPTAADVMTREIHCLRATATVRELLEQMRAQLVSGVPIVDDAGRAVGLVSQNDVARALALADASGGEPRAAAGALVDQALAAGPARAPGIDQLLARPARDVMTPVVWSCRPEAPLDEVGDIMVQRRIHRVLVCDAGRKVLGIVSALDLVRRYRDDLRKG